MNITGDGLSNNQGNNGPSLLKIILVAFGIIIGVSLLASVCSYIN